MIALREGIFALGDDFDQGGVFLNRDKQKNMPLADPLKEYIDSGRISFHIPGHKGRGSSAGMQALAELFSDRTLAADITEIDGFDDLHHPEGVIREAQRLAADLFGAEETFFLVNGTTSGIMAAVASVAYENAPILVCRDCHKSVTRGLILSGAMPIYIENKFDDELEIPCGISVSSVREALENNPGVKGLILTNPSYYGTYSDLEEIVKLCHSRGAAVIADEAHGAQLYFTDQEGIREALCVGCDISVQSTHKMLGSLTQSSMLHVRGDIVDRKRLRYNVSFMNSTSPSYLLMSSLDAVRRSMAESGRGIWKDVLSLVSDAQKAIGCIDGMRCITHFTDADGIHRRLEGSRLLISAQQLGLSGTRLAELLTQKHRIDVEFSDDIYIIAVGGSGSQKQEFDALVQALKEISEEYKDRNGDETRRIVSIGQKTRRKETSFSHHSVMSPRNAFYSEHEVIPLKEAEGRTAAFEAAVYPPGMPVLYPGEAITEEIRDFLLDEIDKGSHLHGIIYEEDGMPMICVVAGKEESMLFSMLF